MDWCSQHGLFPEPVYWSALGNFSIYTVHYMMGIFMIFCLSHREVVVVLLIYSVEAGNTN